MKVFAGADPVRYLRRVGCAEAVSFLLLLGVAMPLKHLAQVPEPVAVLGWLHGGLFIAFVAVWLWSLPRLPWGWAALAFVAALVPGGPFWVDGKLRRFESRGVGQRG